MAYKIKEDVKEQLEDKPKKKKGLPGIAKFFIALFSIIIGIPVLCVGLVYACFFDGAHTSVDVKEDYATERVFSEVLVDAFDESVSEQKLSLQLKERQLNQMLYNVYSNNEQLKQFVKNIYVDVNNATTKFVFEGDIFGYFKTRIFLTTNFTVDEDEGILKFKVTDIKIGRISGMQKVLDLVKNFVELPELNDELKKMGLSLNIDLNNLEITYKLEDFYQDLNKLMGGTEGGEFFSILSEILSNQSLRTIGTKEKSMFAIDVDINKLKVTSSTLGIDEYTIPDGYFDSATSTIMTAVKEFLNAGSIEKKDADLVAKYMMGGDNILSGDEPTNIQQYKDAHLFDSYSVPYFDYSVKSEDQIKNIINSQIPSTVTSSVDVYVTTTQVDKMLKASPSTGIITTFTANLGTETERNYKTAYVLSDRITSTIKNDTLYITTNMNLNGTCGHITLKCPRVSGTTAFGQYEYTMDKMYLGDVEVSANTKDTFSRIILKALEGDAFAGVISASTVTNKITIDFNSVLSEHSITSDNFDLEFAMEDSTKDNAGQIKLTITPKI